MTLIEILVAVSLMGLLAGALAMALQMGASSWQSTRERLMADRRIATANQILNAEFAGIVPIEAERPPGVGAGPRNTPFFQGEPQSMRFVSDYSLTAGVRGGLQIVELQVIPSKGQSRVLLNQHPYQGPRSAGRLILDLVKDPLSSHGRLLFAPILPRADSLIIADRLASCSFSYLRAPKDRREPATWVSHWAELREFPLAIRVEMQSAAERTPLRPVSITAAVHSRFAPAGAPAGGTFQGGASPPPAIMASPIPPR